MKKVYKDKIINIEETDLYDNQFLFDYMDKIEASNQVEVIYMDELLKKRENTELLNNLANKFAMYSNVYSPKDELDIFQELFDNAILNNKKIHIVWVTLKSEIELLEEYYTKLWFLREDINCFRPDFSIPLITVSVNIENLIWKWSDYKASRKDIFFIPPVRESWENKAMFKWINRWVIAGINIKSFDENIEKTLWDYVREEKILPMTLSKLLKYNLEEIGFNGKQRELIIKY